MAPAKKRPAKKTPAKKRAAGRAAGGSSSAEQRGEFRYSDEVGTALVDGLTFRAKAVQYLVVDGQAIVEGDINLGAVEEVQHRTEMRRAELGGAPIAAAVLISGAQFRWPDCRVPYQIDAALPNQNRVTDAIAHWETNTNFSFVHRTPANEGDFPDFVEFVPGGGCSSFVGRQGGRQTVTLAAGCSTGNCIHEIGHAVGLWHEQSREDRDAFVTIQWANILPAAVNNFAQHITDGDDVGGYDYGSIMHYPRDAFTSNGNDTIVPVDPNAQIGQRVGLSAGDIAAANSMCPKGFKESPKDIIKEFPKDRPKDIIKEPIKETPKELPKDIIKEPPKDLPKDFPKDHVKETPKDFPKDPPKDFPKDPPKDLKEGPRDPKGFFEPPKGVFEPPKGVFEPPKGVLEPPKGFMEPPGPIQPGGLPFVLGTGAEAVTPPTGGTEAAASLLAAYRQLLDRYAAFHAQGLLGPRDLAMWQQCATAAQQIAADSGLA